MAFAPFLTRLYGPEAFGVQGVFITLSSILATVAALCYPTAIVLPKSDDDARGLAKLSVYLAFAISIITTLLLWLFGQQLLILINSEVIFDFIYLIPIFMLFSVFSAVLGQWLIRKNAFKVSAVTSVWQSFLINSIKAGFGFVAPSAAVLVITSTAGNLLQAYLLFSGLARKGNDIYKKSNTTKIPALLVLAKQYGDFALLRSPQVFLNAVSHSLPIVLLATYYGPIAVGYYTITNSVLGMPTVLIGASVMQVFYPKANETYQNGESISALIIKTTLSMAAVGAVPFMVVILFGPFLFKYFFGSEWLTAGIYAQWLASWFFLGYVSRPAIAAIPVLRLQKGFFFYEIFSTASKAGAIILGYYFFKSDVVAIALFSIAGCFAYLYLIAWVALSANRKIYIESL
ncbi:hypothetical protein PS639_04632 [Pseudomonas fluorescens]|nr:hypothetical protein PS639_04632 [Pseudomonas fluorescens]